MILQGIMNATSFLLLAASHNLLVAEISFSPPDFLGENRQGEVPIDDQAGCKRKKAREVNFDLFL